MGNNKLLSLTQLEPLCILRMLLRNLWLIILAACIGFFSASAFLVGDISRSYSSSATFVVTPQTSNYYNQLSAASSSANTYAELLDSDLMYRVVSDSLNGEYEGVITANQIGNTNLIAVTVTADTPAAALLIMQALAENYDTLSGYISSSATISLLNTPSLSTLIRNRFNSGSFAWVAAIVCAAVMVAILLIIVLFTGTVQSEQAAKELLEGKLLVTVPHERGANAWLKGPRRSKQTPRITSPNVSFHFAESIHRLAENCEREHAAGKRVFLMTSVLETEGKSTVAMNAALSLAMKKNRVLLLDLDLRRPVQARNLGLTVSEKQNLGKLLEAHAAPKEIISNAVIVKDSTLYALLSTQSYPNAAELIASKTLSDLLDHARQFFDYIIIDLPPMGYFSEGEAMLDQADAAVLVVRQDVVPAAVINDCIDALRSGRAEFLGYVLNDVNTLSNANTSYGGYKYGSYGGYSYSKSRFGKSNDFE